MEESFSRAFVRTLSHANTLAQVARPFLSVLCAMTDLDCAFLTEVGPLRRRLRVHTSHPTRAGGVVVFEGMSCAWDDALCKCALDDSVPYTSAADARWTRNLAVGDMGVKTYASQPIWNARGLLLGTLCAADKARVPMHRDTLLAMDLFARLIGRQIERLDVWGDDWLPWCQEQSVRLLDDALARLSNRPEMEARLRRAVGLTACEESVVD